MFASHSIAEDATRSSFSSFEIPSISSSVNVRSTLRTIALTPIAEASTEAVGAGADDHGFVPVSSSSTLPSSPEDRTGQDAARDGSPETAHVNPQGTSRGSDPAGDNTSAAVTRTVRPQTIS